MFTISKPLIATAAVIATLVVVADMAQSRTPELTAAAMVAHRFPQPNEMLAQRSGAFAAPTDQGRKRGTSTNSCTREHWPYIADECLTSAGEPARRPVRTISTERRIAENAAQPALQLAAR